VRDHTLRRCWFHHVGDLLVVFRTGDQEPLVRRE
jgi:hypothetical protein